VDLVEFLIKSAGSKGELHLRPDPEPRERHYTVISVDDHLIEPADTFTGRLPKKFEGIGPRIERGENGTDWWVFEDERIPLLAADAIQSWAPGEGYLGPITYEELRPAVYKVADRVRDMDISGVYASLNFPSAPFGFAGQRFMRMKDPELGLASMRAFNDWVFEEWYSPFPDRIIPSQVTWLHDPKLAAAEIERNAARGFKAVSFSENPEKLGLPSIYKPHWDPFLRACEETETVINLHVGSSSETLVPSSDSAGAVLGILFPVNGFSAATDWLFARVPLRFPNIKIALSEGGIGWVAMLLDRLSYIMQRTKTFEGFEDESPLEVFRRAFWFTTFSDPRSLALRHEIGIDRIMVETDYPHSDSTWPDTQELLAKQLDGVPRDEADKLTYLNAAALYRHPVVAAV
jgi:predicted TIM-barrel fold metal-dependent hydrolase